MSEHILLLQTDLGDLPFQAASFRDVLCLNVLHQFKAAEALISNLKGLLTEGGHLYLTSLVSNNRFVGDRYMDVLHATGEFVRPRSGLELREILDRSFNHKASCSIKGNMAYVTTDMLA